MQLTQYLGTLGGLCGFVDRAYMLEKAVEKAYKVELGEDHV